MDAAEPNVQKIADLNLRVIAYIIDLAVIGLVRAILEALNIPHIALSENSFLITHNIFLLALMFLYLCVLPVFLSGRTLGKLAMGIRIVTVDGSPLTVGRLFLRNWVGYIVSGIPVGIGFLWALTNENRQTWHDILAETVVVRDETAQLNNPIMLNRQDAKVAKK